MRNRVNISVDDELHGRMKRAARRYGFRNLCRLAVASIRTVLDAQDRVASAGVPPHGEPDPDDHITEMFRDFADAENDRKGTRAKTGAHKNDDI